MFLEGTRAYEITNSPYMNEIKGIEKQPIIFLHFTWDFFNAIMHNLFSLTAMFSLLGYKNGISFRQLIPRFIRLRAQGHTGQTKSIKVAQRNFPHSSALHTVIIWFFNTKKYTISNFVFQSFLETQNKKNFSIATITFWGLHYLTGHGHPSRS